MNLEEKMFSLHTKSLTSHYTDFKNMKFQESYRDKNDPETIVTKSPSNKIAYVTRHDNLGNHSYTIIFDKDWYGRV